MPKLPLQTLDFFDRAPLRVTDSAVVALPPEKVFELYADAASWPKWFPLMHRAEWVSADKAGVGAEREVSLHLLGTYRERFIAWEPGARFSFTMTESSSPLARALAEDFRFSKSNGGTRIDWCLAAEPTLLGRALRRGLEAIMTRVFRASGPRLERYARRRG